MTIAWEEFTILLNLEKNIYIQRHREQESANLNNVRDRLNEACINRELHC